MIIIKKINKELTVLGHSVILTGFMDPDLSLNDYGLQKLKRNEQYLSHLRSKILSKQLYS
jgi:uncharacterized protein YvpB